MSCTLSKEQINQTISFHGHWCPGLAIGIRAAEWVLINLGRAQDGDIVSVVETDMCGVDAVQFLTGCTFGKGNLIHKDYGKNAFTFYRRRDGKAARLVSRPDIYTASRETLSRLHLKRQAQGLPPEEEKEWNDVREKMSSHIMAADLSDLFETQKPTAAAPEKARILNSLICDSCGEATMETRTRKYQERTFCIPCFESLKP